jgi:hypothetical protein
MPRNQVFDPEDREPERDDEPIGSDRRLSHDDESPGGCDGHGYHDGNRDGYDQGRDHHDRDPHVAHGSHRPPDDAEGVDLDLDFDLDFEEADIIEVLDDDDLKQMDGPDA